MRRLQAFDRVEEYLDPAFGMHVQKREGLSDAFARIFNVLEGLCITSVGWFVLQLLTDHQRRQQHQLDEGRGQPRDEGDDARLDVTAGKVLWNIENPVECSLSLSERPLPLGLCKALVRRMCLRNAAIDLDARSTVEGDRPELIVAGAAKSDMWSPLASLPSEQLCSAQDPPFRALSPVLRAAAGHRVSPSGARGRWRQPRRSAHSRRSAAMVSRELPLHERSSPTTH